MTVPEEYSGPLEYAYTARDERGEGGAERGLPLAGLVAGDCHVLYWRVFKAIGLAPVTPQGSHHMWDEDFLSHFSHAFWEPGADTSQYSWWDGGSFHPNLRDSTELKPQERRYVELDAAPERVRQVHRRMKPHYDHLFRYRLKPGD